MIVETDCLTGPGSVRLGGLGENRVIEGASACGLLAQRQAPICENLCGDGNIYEAEKLSSCIDCNTCPASWKIFPPFMDLEAHIGGGGLS